MATPYRLVLIRWLFVLACGVDEAVHQVVNWSRLAFSQRDASSFSWLVLRQGGELSLSQGDQPEACCWFGLEIRLLVGARTEIGQLILLVDCRMVPNFVRMTEGARGRQGAVGVEDVRVGIGGIERMGVEPLGVDSEERTSGVQGDTEDIQEQWEHEWRMNWREAMVGCPYRVG